LLHLRVTQDTLNGMKYVTAKELRLRTRQILEEAGSGQQIAVTYRGKPVAVLLPFDEEAEFTVRPYAEAWKDIDAALARSRPAYRRVEDALRASRRRP